MCVCVCVVYGKRVRGGRGWGSVRKGTIVKRKCVRGKIERYIKKWRRQQKKIQVEGYKVGIDVWGTRP